MASFTDYTNEYLRKKKKKDQEEEEERSYGPKSFTEYTEEYVERNTTPVSKKEEKEDSHKSGTFDAPVKDTWLKKGALEDGLSFKNLERALRASKVDVATNILGGVLDMGEKAVDFFAGIAPYYAQGQYNMNGGDILFGDNQKRFQETLDASKQASAKFIAKDLYDGQKVAEKIISDPYDKITGTNTEEDSVLGTKMQSTVQSGGQMLATKGLSKLFVPWPVVTGVTAWGAEAEAALQQGATLDEAMFSGLVTAGGEVATELLSGGINFGSGTVDDMLTKRFGQWISNKTLRTLVKFGVDVAGEGGEEVLSEAISAVGKKLSYLSDEEMKEILTKEDALDAFIGGAIMGGTSSGFGIAASGVKGVDYTTGFTKNEQAVVEKVYNDRLEEARRSGKTLTAAEKTEIYDDVLDSMEKGLISIDTIEETLSGKEYEEYKKLKREADEYESLAETEYGRLSARQVDRWNELKWKNDTKPYAQALKEAKGKISQNVAEMVKGDRLFESYREDARRGEDFVPDFDKFKGAKYADAARKTLESATKVQFTDKKTGKKSGMNNIRAVHDFVDFLAKVSGDTGLVFDLNSGEQVKAAFIERKTEQIKAIESIPEEQRTPEQTAELESMRELLRQVESGETTVNGNTDTQRGNIVLNLDSNRALNVTVGHEVTHNLEKAKAYGYLRNALYSYAEAKGIDVKAELASRKATYSGESDADIEAEFVADMVGEYLFTDQAFINHLAADNRNVFQKIWDDIKHLCKLATAGSKEARELERVKRAFEKAYRETGEAQKNTAISGINYSVSYEDAIDDLSDGKLDRVKNTHLLVAEHTPQVFIDKAGAKDLKIITDWETAYLAMNKGGELSGNYHGLGADVMKAIPKALEDPLYIVKRQDGRINAVTEVVVNGNRPVLVSVELDAFKIPTMDGAQEADNYNLIVTFFDAKSNYLQNRVFAGEIKYNKNNEDPAHFISRLKSLKKAVPIDDLAESSFADSIPHNGNPVNAKYSLGDHSLSDSTGRQLTPEQAEYFKDSKVRDENGNLRVMWHGTASDFTVFDIAKAGKNWGGDSRLGKGFYFADNREDALRWTDGSRAIEAYLNITNPLDVTASPPQNIVEEIDKYIDNKVASFDESSSWITKEQYIKNLQRIKEMYMKDVSMFVTEFKYDDSGKMTDGIREFLSALGYDGIVSKDETVAFYPEQIKLTTNTNPTADPDIRYSLSEDGKAEVVDGIAVAVNTAEIMKSSEYSKPEDYTTKYSYSTTDAWKKNYLASHNTVNDFAVVDAVERFTNAMVQDDAVRGYVPMGEYKYDKMGPLRTNVEYIWTFDMDTSCPRTFQFLNFRDAIQRKAGRYLTYNESINLLELMRAYGQQIPCCYCYVENKRVLLSASYNNFFNFRNAVMTAESDEAAAKAMYGYSEKKGLPDASKKAMARWRADLSYNPSVTDIWTATSTARNSVLNFLDGEMATGNIDAKTAQSKLNRMVLDRFGITDKGAVVEIEGFVKDWAYDTLANIPHIYNTDNNTDVSVVDERALALNHEALAYSKSASSAKSVENYVPYTDQLKNVSEEQREYIIGMGGIRKHSSNDFRMDYVQDYFLFYADLAAGKWTGHTYTKSADFAKVFACTGDRINMSIAFYEDADGTLRENIDEGASWRDVQQLRRAYKNVGSMAMVTSDNQLSYALNADWVDMIIPFHASGLDKSVWYNLRMWNDYTTKQGERFYNADTMKQKLTAAGIEVPKDAKADDIKALFEANIPIKRIYGKNGEVLKPHFFPGDTYVNGQLVPGHHNSAETYFRLCEEYGVHPRFYGVKVTDTNGNLIDATEHPSYLKLIKETSRTDTPQEEIQFNFGNYDDFLKMTPFEYAMQRLQEEAKIGGFDNTKADPYGVVGEFVSEYLDKDRPLGYLTDRAKETREILLEMSRESAKQQSQIVDEARSSLSRADEVAPTGGYRVYGKDLMRTDPAADVAPVADTMGAPNVAYTPSEFDADFFDDTAVVNPNARPATDFGAKKPKAKKKPTASEPMKADAPETAPVADSSTVADSTTVAPIGDQPIKTVEDRLAAKLQSVQTELANNQRLREEANADFDKEIARLQAEYDAKKNKTSVVANDLLRRIERQRRLKASTDAGYAKRISDLEARIEKMSTPEYRIAEQRRAKSDEYTALWEELIGDTSTWKDMPIGLQYKTKTLRRSLRKVVKDATGNADIQKADRIYDELETKYDHNEALLKRESQRLKEVFAKLKLNRTEDTYAHMLGELRHNPDTTLTEDAVKAYYNKHKGKIDTAKVDTAITEARQLFDDLIVRVNEVLREQGMKEIPYRKGYFPHFTKPKQTWLMKAFNWKPVDTEIPTSIAGLTEAFKPQRSWQSFNKERMGDATDYSLYQGLDTYIHGALDWIYHIEDLQKRRALENLIRYTHSEEGVKERIKKIQEADYDADDAQELIDAVLAEARNPLSGLVRELMNRTNTLANKKSALDRSMEDATNRKIYSTMTNLNNRVTANMVVGSFSSALTNFIPLVQSWHQVSPFYTVRGLGDFVRSAVRDDGMVAKSDFLTNRLIEEEALYKTGWDKVTDKAAIMMTAFDSITSQAVWRSKYLQNLHEGMSEAEAIKDADQFAKNLIAGRSRGNAPSIFDSKNPLIKIFTAFQLEVANQYGYMFEDLPTDSKNKVRLIKGYAAAFMGAYLYNSLYSSLVGRDAAFDPLGILEDLLKDVFGDDDEEEEEVEDIIQNFAGNVIEEVPFIGGLAGGGRVPISSALPYSNDSTPFKSMLTDVSDGNWEAFGKEFLKPLYYLAMPVGGGQLKKTVEGLSMFSDDHPVAGSYTDSGSLRYPVEDNFGNRLQAGLFGQYSSEIARDYFDNSRSPLKEKQIQEFIDVEMPIRDYWDYREELKEQETLEDKFDYIAGLDLPVEKKNILINNIVDRKNDVDLENYDDFADYEEFDFYSKNEEKYKWLEDNGVKYWRYTASDKAKEKYDAVYSWYKNNPEKVTVSRAVTDNVIEYREYTSALNDIRADKDSSGKTIVGSAKEKKIEYINNLDLDYGARLILFKSEYNADDTYNNEIIEYINGRDDFTYEERVTILRELGFTVTADGHIYWD